MFSKERYLPRQMFSKFWQIGSIDTKSSKSISDYSKHVYFSERKYKTPLPWKEHYQLISKARSLYDSILSLKELLRNIRENLNPPELFIIFHAIMLLELTNQLFVCVMPMIHLLKGTAHF